MKQDNDIKQELQQRFDNGETIEFDTPTIVLGSASATRTKILTDAGIEFVKIISSVDDNDINYQHPHENVSKRALVQYIKKMALAKLDPFIGRIKNGAVITADTIAFYKGKILEKPLTREKCREQHELLSGKTNYAYTAVAVHYNGKTLCKVMISKVCIRPLPECVLNKICDEPATLHAAGYRIAGVIAPYVKIKNNAHRHNVMGLDPGMVRKMLASIGFKVLDRV